MNEPSTTKRELIDPETLMRIKSLELRAKIVVEGFQNGLNRSPQHGFSVEFTEYRQYSPGDDPRYLDWKLYARSDRHFIKLFEDETNLRCDVLVDLSKSMDFGSGTYNKADYARTLVATLAFFLSKQRDAAGLMTFDESVREYIPARFRPGHLRRIMVALERKPDGRSTSLKHPLVQAAERLGKRGMVVLVSDLLAPLDQFADHLTFLRTRGHEVIVFQILDPLELEFQFDKPALFEDVETGDELYIDPEAARESYLSRLQQHLDQVDTTCARLGIPFRRVTTDEPLENVLGEFLRQRMSSRMKSTARGRGRTK
ncbi:MAG: DUF58 domain-containing protein [Planctomycetaceae bacterium]